MKTNKEGGITVGTALDDIIIRLNKYSDSQGLDAREVLARVMKHSPSWVMAHPEELLTPKTATALEKLVNRLEGGEPLPYVLGRHEFFGLEFEVDPEVLIPPSGDRIIGRNRNGLASRAPALSSCCRCRNRFRMYWYFHGGKYPRFTGDGE